MSNFFLPVLLYALTYFTLPNRQVDYFDYHQKIIYAEELFIQDSIQKSLTEYKKIFTLYSPFAKDAFIALELACMINDTSQAKYFFEKSFSSGIDWDALWHVKHITNLLHKYPDYKKVIQKLYEGNRKKYTNRIDIELKRRFTTLSRKDNNARKAYNTFVSLYRDSVQKRADDSLFQKALDKEIYNHPTLKYYRTSRQDSTSEWYWMTFRSIRKNYVPQSIYDTLWVKIMEDNLTIIDSISKKLGYVPGEKSIGLLDDGYWEKIRESQTLTLSPISIHQLYHHGCAFSLLKNELMESVRRGEIHPRIFVEVYAFSAFLLKDKISDPSVNQHEKIYAIKCEPPKMWCIDYQIANLEPPTTNYDTSKINECRKELSISSIQHDKFKREYAKKHHLILFFGLLGSEM